MRRLAVGCCGLVLAAVLLLSPGEARALGHARSCAPPPPRQTVLLEVCHPKTCCKQTVSVCVPCCCQGPPAACYQCTLLGHGKTVFTWPCGYQVTVRYTCCGGVRVVQRD